MRKALPCALGLLIEEYAIVWCAANPRGVIRAYGLQHRPPLFKRRLVETVVRGSDEADDFISSRICCELALAASSR